MNQFDDDILIHPVKGKKEKDIPASGVFFVNPGEAQRAMKRVESDGGKREFLHNSNLAIQKDKNSFVAGPAVGAPAAVLVLEKLIALGAKEIILMGWCGAIAPSVSIGDIVIPTSGLSGEGTSQYYTDDNWAQPSEDLVHRTEQMFSTEQHVCTGKMWSTDAPYRESRTYLEDLLNKENVAFVDMEFSALCNVARFRGIKFCGVMVVSDELHTRQWNHGFRDKKFLRSCRLVMDQLLASTT